MNKFLREEFNAVQVVKILFALYFAAMAWITVKDIKQMLRECTVVYCECHDPNFLPYPKDAWGSRAYKTALSNFIQ